MFRVNALIEDMRVKMMDFSTINEAEGFCALMKNVWDELGMKVWELEIVRCGKCQES